MISEETKAILDAVCDIIKEHAPSRGEVAE